MIQKIAGESQIKQVETDKALPPSADSRRSVPMHKKEKMFFNNIDTYDITKLAGYVKESNITIFIHKVIRKLKKNDEDNCININGQQMRRINI